jgi:hypothetical protein
MEDFLKEFKIWASNDQASSDQERGEEGEEESEKKIN